MEFRSTNPEGFVHFGGDVMSGANCTRGVQLSSNVVKAVSDNAAEDLVLAPKGSGKLLLGSTVSLQIVSGQSTTTIPNMAANSQDVSTFAAAGISTGDIILSVDSRGVVSTGVAMGGYRCTAANKITVVWTNCHASSIAAESTGFTVRWAYLDRT